MDNNSKSKKELKIVGQGGGDSEADAGAESSAPASAASGERKQRVLHTRVPESLEQELKRRASELGVSVSNLVRNVLGNTFDMVEGVVLDTSDLARAATVGRTRTRAMAGEAPAIVGWQELILEVNALCEQCNDILPRGSRAALAIPTSPDRPVFRCLSCVPTAGESK